MTTAQPNNNKAVSLLHVQNYTNGILGPSQAMLGPLANGGKLITSTPPGCWGPMITPAFQGGHEVTQPVAIEGTVRVTILCPMHILDRKGIGHLVREKYAL